MKLTSTIHGLILFCVTFLIYSNSFHGEFVFDDRMFILGNVGIRDIFDIKTIWNLLGYPARFIAFYTFALNYHFHQYNVFGYHVVNFVIHLLNVFCVYGIVNKLIETPGVSEKIKERKTLTALIVALLFATHPIQTQAVTYITQRFASLATLFYLTALWSYLKGRLSNRKVWFVVAVISGILGMFSKQIVMTLPLNILLMEWCFFNKKSIEKNSYFTPISIVYSLAILAFVLVVPAFFKFKVSQMLAMTTESGSHAGDVITSWSYFLSQPRVVVTYICLLFVPFGQNLDYDFPISPSLWHGPTLISIMIILSLMGLGIALRKKNPLLSFGMLWFFHRPER